jgi:glucokinase
MIGVELLESHAVAVSIDDGGRVLARATAEHAASAGAAAELALDQIARGEAIDRSIGIASPNPTAPAVVAAADALARRVRASALPHAVCSSGTAAALAEAWVGAGRGVHDVVYFAVADHTTAGIVRGGAPVVGSRGRAGSVAWLSLNPVEREDYRKIGCLEAEAAAAGIVRRLIWRIKAGDRSRIQDVVNDLSAITLDHVLEAARGGDGVSISVVRDTAKYLGMAAANLVVVVDPDMLVLGGIMASAADLMLEPLRNEITRRLPRVMMDELAIAPATLGGDAAAIGAARLAAAAPQDGAPTARTVRGGVGE